MRAVLVAAAAALLAFGAAAQEKSGKRLQDVETQLEKGRAKESALEKESRALVKEAEQIREKAIATARGVQDREEAISSIEKRLDALDREYAARSTALGGQKAQLVRLLSVLERIAVIPPEGLAARPGVPSDAIRSAILLRAAIPPVEARGRELQTELQSLAQLRADIGARRKELAAAVSGLKTERDRLDELAQQKAKLAETRTEERESLAKRNARLAGEAKDLRELLERIEASRPRVPPPKPGPPPPERAERPSDRPPDRQAEKPAEKAQEQAETVALVAPERPSGSRGMGTARGQFLLPVRGTVIKAFGQDTGPSTEKGVTIETRLDAQVVAPYDGQIVFSGPFRGYGLILIIDHGDGYHSLLVGLSRADGAVGQWVVAGEPVGSMGHPESGKPALYVELRRHGKPVNPAPFLAARNDKVGQ